MNHLTIDGHLTRSQQDEAHRLGIPYMEYINTVLTNLAKYNEDMCRNNNNKTRVKCKNPIIIVGHGPGWEIQAEKLRDTRIPIIATDVCSVPLMDMGIIPTYIVTYESAYKRINESLFDFDRINKHSVQVIGSKITRDWLDKALEKIGMDFYRYDEYEAHTVDNVGIFGCMFAENILKVDKIIFIGMNSWDGDRGNPYLNWYINWMKYISKMPDKFIINCTRGGLLYNGKITECDFSNLEIVYE